MVINLIVSNARAHETTIDSWLENICGSSDSKTKAVVIRCDYANSVNSKIDALIMIHSRIVGESSEAGEVTVFFEKSKGINKVSIQHYGEMGKVNFNYYYDNGHLYLINRELTHYDRPINMQGSTVESIDRDMFLIYGESLIGKLTEKGYINGSDDDNEVVADAIFTVNKVLKLLPLVIK